MNDAPTKNINFLIPMAHVVDVQRSVDFYAHLGFEPLNIGKDEDGQAQWAHVKSGSAHLMFARDAESAKIEKESSVVLYMYSQDLVKLRAELVSKGVKVSEISYPFYMPKGEVCLSDPDGYVVLVGQSD
jgi:hypothetical protein